MKPCCPLLLAILAATSGWAQAPNKGMLLVATPDLRDPRFTQTVVLLLHYESEGALGVAINRPTWVDPASAFPEMEFLQDYSGRVYVGGPVARANVLVLLRDPDVDVQDNEPVFDDVYVTADREFLRSAAATANTDQNLRLYAGHASWEAGQLDREIAAGHWQVVPANPDLVFTTDPLQLWQQLQTLGSEMSVSVPFSEGALVALP